MTFEFSKIKLEQEHVRLVASWDNIRIWETQIYTDSVLIYRRNLKIIHNRLVDLLVIPNLTFYNEDLNRAFATWLSFFETATRFIHLVLDFLGSSFRKDDFLCKDYFDATEVINLYASLWRVFLLRGRSLLREYLALLLYHLFKVVNTLCNAARQWNRLKQHLWWNRINWSLQKLGLFFTHRRHHKIRNSLLIQGFL